jgi:hypothetical protein
MKAWRIFGHVHIGDLLVMKRFPRRRSLAANRAKALSK